MTRKLVIAGSLRSDGVFQIVSADYYLIGVDRREPWPEATESVRGVLDRAKRRLRWLWMRGVNPDILTISISADRVAGGEA